MAIASYADLQTAVLSWLHREGDADMIARMPDFISLAETRMARDLRVLQLEKEYSFQTVAGTAAYALPADSIALTRIFRIDADGRRWPMEEFDPTLEATYTVDEPEHYSMEAGLMRLHPTPSAVRTVTFVYRAKIAPLTALAPSNQTLADHPNLYLFGALVEAATWVLDDAAAVKWESRYGQAVISANRTDNYKSKALLTADAGLRTERFNYMRGW